MEGIDQIGVVFALVGGIVPAFFWLKFWLKEDAHGEPRSLILRAFVMGMVITIVALFFEDLSGRLFGESGPLIVVIWAAVEEILKFAGAYIAAIHTRFTDEPIDPAIYLISTALGFAAFENFIFVLGSLYKNEYMNSFVTANLRFIGPTLLHVVCSALIGIFYGYVFYKKGNLRKFIIATGVILAVLLHALFNSFIIAERVHPLIIFTGVWVGVIATILVLEKIKKIKNI